MATCRCRRARSVRLREPKVTRRVVSGVMAKSLGFVQGLPSFCRLPPEDRAALLRQCWGQLLLVGLAQEGVAVEVTDAPPVSLLRRILLAEEEERPTLAQAHRLRRIMEQLWSLELSPKEYAYLKGALLFNPGKNLPEPEWFNLEPYQRILKIRGSGGSQGPPGGSCRCESLLCCSCSRPGGAILHQRPPSGGSDSPQGGGAPPAPCRRVPPQPRPLGCLFRPEHQPPSGVPAVPPDRCCPHWSCSVLRRQPMRRLKEP